MSRLQVGDGVQSLALLFFFDLWSRPWVCGPFVGPPWSFSSPPEVPVVAPTTNGHGTLTVERVGILSYSK